MKRTLITLLAALLCLVSCASGNEESSTQTTSPESVSSDTGTAAETEPAEDAAHDFLDDYTLIEPSGEHDVSILFLNVGKADAILVCVDSSVWLIDTGTAVTEPILFAGLKTVGAEWLNGVFITHTDNDHVGGLQTLVENFPVDAVYTAAITTDYDKVERMRGDVPRISLEPGAVVEAAEGVWFEVLGPYVYNDRDDNNSLVLRLRVNDTVTLFTGDMMDEEEYSLLDAGLDLDCDILKVGHHGKKDATSNEFLAAASPDYAIIPANQEEESDSAHKSVVKALKKYAEVWITQDVSLGIVAEIPPDGQISVDEQKPLEKPA